MEGFIALGRTTRNGKCVDEDGLNIKGYSDQFTSAYPMMVQDHLAMVIWGDEYDQFGPIVFNDENDNMWLAEYNLITSVGNPTGFKYSDDKVIKNDLGGLIVYQTALILKYVATWVVYNPDEFEQQPDPVVSEGQLGHVNHAGYGNRLRLLGLPPQQIEDPQPTTGKYEHYSVYSPNTRPVHVHQGMVGPIGDTNDHFVDKSGGKDCIRLPKGGVLFVSMSATSNFVNPDYFVKNTEAYPMECWREKNHAVLFFSFTIWYFTLGADMQSVEIDNYGRVDMKKTSQYVDDKKTVYVKGETRTVSVTE